MKKIIKSKLLKSILLYTFIFSIVSLFLCYIYYRNNKLLMWQEDGFEQHVVNLTSFREFLIHFFKTGKLDIFYFNIGAGMDMFSNYAYYITGDLFSYTSVLFPANKMPLLYSLLFFVRLYFAGIAFIIYCKHKKLNTFPSVIGAIMYAFCTFALIGVFRHPYFANAMIVFPMVILALERLIIDNKPILYSVMIAIMFIMSFYFAYMLSIIIGLYAIILIIYKYKDEGIKKIIITLLKVLLYSVIGVLISAAILLPVANAFLNTERSTLTKIYPYTLEYYRNMMNDVLSVKTHGYWLDWGVQSLILLTLPKFYKTKNKEVAYKILLPILCIPILISIIGSIFCGFAYPNNRWIFVISFIFAFMTAHVLNDGNFDKKDYVNTSILIIIFLLLDVIFDVKIERIIVIEFLILTSLITITKYKNTLENKFKKINVYTCLFSIIFTIGILSSVLFSHSVEGNGYINESISRNEYRTLVNSTNKTIPKFNESIDYLNLVDSDNYYRVMRYPYSFTNVAMLMNFNQIGSYYSLTPQIYKDFIDDIKLSEYQTSLGIKDMDYRTRITSLLGNKYIITADKDTKPYNYKKEVDINDNNHIYINKNTIDFATLYTNYINIDDYNKLSPLEKEISLTKQVALANNTNDLKTKKIDYSKYIKKVDYKIIDDLKLIKNNKFKINNGTKNNTFKIKVNKVKDSEVYINIKGLKHKGFTKKEILKSKIKKKTSKKKQNEIKYKYAWYTPANQYAYKINYEDKEFTKSVKNNLTSPYYLDNSDYLLNLGYYDKFEGELTITFLNSGNYSYDSIEIYSVKMKDYKDDIKKLNKANFKLDNYKNSYMKFTVEPEEDGILQLSTFYNEGLDIYVDGNKIDKLKVNKYFIGTYITKGKHTIELRHTTQYLKEGSVASLIGIILLLLLFIFRKPSKDKQSLFMRFWNWGWGIYHKNEELWNYLIVGGLTTIVSLGTYYGCVFTFLNPKNGLQLQCANIISWVIAVIFAYITNRIFVFKSKEKNIKKEATSFIGSRVLTLLIDMGLMFLMVTILHLNDKFSKIFDQIIVVVVNYIISKLIVFKK